MDLQGILRGLQILAIFLIAQVDWSSQQLPWGSGVPPTMQGIINTGANFGGIPAMNGIIKNVLPNGLPPPNPIGGIGLPSTFASGVPHTSIPHTYNGRRSNYRLKRSVPRSRPQEKRQGQPRGQGRRGRRPPPSNTWRQNQNPPRWRSGAVRPVSTGRWRRKNGRQNSGRGRKQNQNVEIEREVTGPARQGPRAGRPWRRIRHPAPLQRWNQAPAQSTPPSTTATTPSMWETDTTAPSAWQPSWFDWFSGWFPSETAGPPVYESPPSHYPSSVEHSKKHGTCYCYDLSVCPSDLSLGPAECEDGQITCCED